MPDFLATPRRRKLLFACLYLSEGAPIGFIWLALPTRLRGEGVPLEQITWLTAVLVLPWTFKFAWAPLVDLLRTPRWPLRNWIVSAQAVMGASLLPLIWLDPLGDFNAIAVLLVLHALAAATQDVAIDALCIALTQPAERGAYNGWMQAGMLLGRALMGGGALVMASYVGDAVVVLLLVGLTTFSAAMLLSARVPAHLAGQGPLAGRAAEVGRGALDALRRINTWLGLLFALLGGAAFKSLEVVYGPFLVDRGYTKVEIGWFSATIMIGSMIAGSLAGGFAADRLGCRRLVAAALFLMAVTIAALALSDRLSESARGPHLFVFLALTAFEIGLFTAASYALFMDITTPAIAATQFSAFMGATNGCESWSSYAIGQIAGLHGYPAGMLVMCGASLLALPLLLGLGGRRDDRPSPAN